jgi:hypothetical protein
MKIRVWKELRRRLAGERAEDSRDQYRAMTSTLAMVDQFSVMKWLCCFACPISLSLDGCSDHKIRGVPGGAASREAVESANMAQDTDTISYRVVRLAVLQFVNQSPTRRFHADLSSEFGEARYDDLRVDLSREGSINGWLISPDKRRMTKFYFLEELHVSYEVTVAFRSMHPGPEVANIEVIERLLPHTGNRGVRQ